MAGANNDPFEEFEFRPINEGLGFHRKQKTTAATNSTATTSSAPMKSAALDLGTGATSTSTAPTPAKNKTPSFNSPLPRPETSRPQIQVPTIEDDSISKAQTAVNDILKSLNQKRQIDFVETTAKQKMEYKKSKPQFFASVLDGMLIVSAFLLSLIVMLSITKVDLFMNLSHPQTSGMIYLATAGLFFAVYFVYMVVNRAFVGYTPGEWAFDQVCGTAEQSESLMYIPRLIFRTLLVAFTGFFTLTFISFLFNKDVAGQITGLPLMQKPHA
jgi:hypothetical protein